jgi:flagellar motor switch protein FliG
MILNTSKSEESLSGLRKAAMLLVVLGEEASAQIMQQLSEEEIQRISKEVAKISSISSEQAEHVLNDFHHLSTAGEFVDPEIARRMTDRVVKAIGPDAASFDALQKADPQQLAKFIHNEHPQTIALVLSHLNSTQAAALLASLPPELRADVSRRMASLDQIAPDTIFKITSVIGQKMKTLGEYSRESYGGVRAVAEMLNRLDSVSSREILEHIDQQDAALAETIRQLMFVFEDLMLIDPMGLKELVGKVDRKVLTIAMKGTSEQLRNQIMNCLSQRGADLLREDMDALGPVKIKDVEGAQQQIIALVRRLEADGVINLKGTVGEQYVL